MLGGRRRLCKTVFFRQSRVYFVFGISIFDSAEWNFFFRSSNCDCDDRFRKTTSTSTYFDFDFLEFFKKHFTQFTGEFAQSNCLLFYLFANPQVYE